MAGQRVISVDIAAGALLSALRTAAGVYPPWKAEDFTALLAQPSIRAVVVLQDQIPQGYALFMLSGDEGELYDIAVSESARRAGHGGALLRAVLEAARAFGADHMFLEVAASNVPAQQLYLNNGFAISGRRKAYYERPGGPKEDALVMYCVL